MSRREFALHIVAILRSARKNGTSARIARAFIETAAIYGAAVTECPPNTMHYRGCQGCEGCHTRSDRCVIRDDLTPPLDHLYRAEVWCSPRRSTSATPAASSGAVTPPSGP